MLDSTGNETSKNTGTNEGNVYCGKHTNIEIQSTGTVLSVQLVTDSSFHEKGFRAEFKAGQFFSDK